MPRPKPTATDFDLLTLDDAIAFLGCSKATFNRARGCGLIPPPTPTLGGNRWVRCDLAEANREYAAHAKKWKKRLTAAKGRRPAAG